MNLYRDVKGHGNILKKQIYLYAIETIVGEFRSLGLFRIGLFTKSKLGKLRLLFDKP